nr:MAG TPA: hypothetical protein [Caudoviricetes sp.]
MEPIKRKARSVDKLQFRSQLGRNFTNKCSAAPDDKEG